MEIVSVSFVYSLFCLHSDVVSSKMLFVVKKVKPFAPSDKVCKLCLQEKLSTLRSAPSLNKKKKRNLWTLYA